MDDELTDVIKRDDPIGSPAVALKRGVNRPGYWSHMTDCTCWKCKDLTSVGLDMKYFMLQAQCLIEQGEVSQGEKHWSALVEVTDDLVLQAQQTWSRDILKELPVGKKQSIRPHHEALMLELSLMQAEYRLSAQGDIVRPSLASQSPACGTSVEYWLRQAEKLMGGTGSEELYQQRADLGYLDGVPSLPWPRQTSEIEELCQGIGRVKLAELNVPTPNAQVSTPVNTRKLQPKVNQVKKINRAKPMVGVKKESKTVSGKFERPNISSDSSVIEIESLDNTDDKISPLTSEADLLQSSRKARKVLDNSRKVDAKSTVGEKRGKTTTGRARIISATEPVTIFNDESSEFLAPKKSGRRALSSSTLSTGQKKAAASRESRKSRDTDSVSVAKRNSRNGRMASTRSKLDSSDVFEPSPACKMSPVHETPKNLNKAGSVTVRTPVSCGSKKG